MATVAPAQAVQPPIRGAVVFLAAAAVGLPGLYRSRREIAPRIKTAEDDRNQGRHRLSLVSESVRMDGVGQVRRGPHLI